MQVVSVIPRSYCRGVVLAIRKALQVRDEHPNEAVTLLGLLVHNQMVVDALKRRGIHTVTHAGLSREELLDLVPQGFVIFSAHGVSDAVMAKADRLGLKAVDATCPEVRFTQDLVREQLEAGREVFYVGKAGHPEALSICDGREGVRMITGTGDVPSADALPLNIEIFVTNQTTLSMTDLAEVFAVIRERFPRARFSDEICSATRRRQEAVRNHDNVDVLLVVGDPLSNNTAMLARIGEEAGIPAVYRVESAQDLDLAWFKQSDVVGVTAGASTPPYLIKQIEEYLRELDLNAPGRPPAVDLDHLLDV